MLIDEPFTYSESIKSFIPLYIFDTLPNLLDGIFFMISSLVFSFKELNNP